MDSMDFFKAMITDECRKEVRDYFDEHMALYKALFFIVGSHDSITISVKSMNPMIYNIETDCFIDDDINAIKCRLDNRTIEVYGRLFTFNILNYSTTCVEIQVTPVDRV